MLAGEKIFVATEETQQKILSIVDNMRPKRYGFRKKIAESDPEKRIEYIFDAVGMTPAKMNFETGEFDYGSWKDVWFVKRNYPVVLNRDGSEAYRLNPDDYSQEYKQGENTAAPPAQNEEGRKGATLDDLKNGENAMSAIPLVWVKRYQEDGWAYVVVCEEQYDSSYKAYAHTNKNGDIMPYAYHALYEGYLDNCEAETPTESQLAIVTGCKYKQDPGKCTNSDTCTDVSSCKITQDTCKTYMRSVSGVQPTCFTPGAWELATARRNGPGWDIGYWSLNELIADLLTLMGKNSNTQEVFGQGHTERNASTDNTKAAMMMKTGTMDAKGQFWGSTKTKPNDTQCPGDKAAAAAAAAMVSAEDETMSGVKVFFIENFWGDRWNRQLGMCAKNGDLLIKMTPEGTDGYNLEAKGYPAIQEAKIGDNGGSGFRKATVQTEYGSLPIAPFTGSDSTYECDYFWWQKDETVRVSVFGGGCYHGSGCGARCWSVDSAAAHLTWNFGASLTYLQSSR